MVRSVIRRLIACSRDWLVDADVVQGHIDDVREDAAEVLAEMGRKPGQQEALTRAEIERLIEIGFRKTAERKAKQQRAAKLHS